MIQRLKDLVVKWRDDSTRTHDWSRQVTLRRAAKDLESAIKPQWIQVGDDKPKDDSFVWVHDTIGEVYRAQFIVNRVWIDDGANYLHDNVTHWMPIEKPEPPEVNT